MHQLTTVTELEAVVGTQPLAMMMKAVDALDDGCRAVIANSPVAGFGFSETNGTPWATVLGGAPGFVQVRSDADVTVDIPTDRPVPASGAHVSLVFLLPGVGETLRFTGSVVSVDGTTMHLRMAEAWVHCAKCIQRSHLWEPADAAAHPAPILPDGFDAASSPIGDLGALQILGAAPFAFVTSFDRAGGVDCSPRGDRPGFIRILDEHTVAIPDRKGNRRTDTFHNLIECDELALCALVPGRTGLLHLSGHGFVTDDAELLADMALNEHPPHAALIVRIDRAAVLDNAGVAAGRMWDTDTHVNSEVIPDLMALGAEHLARSKAKGVKATATRLVSKGLAANPRFLRKGVDHGYRKELEEEGF